MKLASFFIFIGILLSGISAQAEVYRHASMFRDLQWKISAMNYVYFDQAGNQFLLKEKFYGLMNHHFLPTVDFSTELLLELQQGATQYIHARKKGNVADGIEIVSSFISVTVLEDIYLKAGAVNQKLLSAPLLISDWAFLGLQQEYFWNNDYLLQYVDDLKITLQQTIPSSSTELDLFSQVQDIANFFTASIFTETFIQDQVQTEGHLTAFYFSNLSAEVADYGRLGGNDVKENYVGANAEFKYPFYGLHFQGQARYNVFPELGLEAKYSFLWNLGAPISRNRGDSFFIGFHIPIHQDVLLVPNVELFRNQHNASPAYYNSDRYGHSARFGFILGVRSQFKKYNVFFDLKYGIIRSYADKRGAIGNPNYLRFEVGTDYEKI